MHHDAYTSRRGAVGFRAVGRRLRAAAIDPGSPFGYREFMARSVRGYVAAPTGFSRPGTTDGARDRYGFRAGCPDLFVHPTTSGSAGR